MPVGTPTPVPYAAVAAALAAVAFAGAWNAAGIVGVAGASAFALLGTAAAFLRRFGALGAQANCGPAAQAVIDGEASAAGVDARGVMVNVPGEKGVWAAVVRGEGRLPAVVIHNEAFEGLAAVDSGAAAGVVAHELAHLRVPMPLGWAFTRDVGSAAAAAGVVAIFSVGQLATLGPLCGVVAYAAACAGSRHVEDWCDWQAAMSGHADGLARALEADDPHGAAKVMGVWPFRAFASHPPANARVAALRSGR